MRAMGVPSVTPASTPLRMITASASSRAVVSSDWPGRRLLSCVCTSAAVNCSRGGQPSTTQPTAAQ